MTHFYIRPQTQRPDFRLLIAFLWPDSPNVDTEGNSDLPESTDWTELYCSLRNDPGQVFDIAPISNDPLTLRIESRVAELAARVTFCLANETFSDVASEMQGPWQDKTWLLNKIGHFDLAEAKQRVASRRLTLLGRDS